MDPSIPTEAREGLEFEKTNWANGSVLENSFYTAPQTTASPGTLLEVEKDVDTTKYLLPPTTALSHIIYQSETLSGTTVPVSAFILWPFSARTQPEGYPIVAWAHGTSGFDANAAPSNHKNLWQHFLAPYQLALQGYVVVGTDYAGLGVKNYPSEEPIVHEYLCSPSQAKDVIYSVQAAQQAFPELSKQWVAIGHSQGGGAVWSIAQIAATREIQGYLGGVPISPYTNILEEHVEFANLLALAMVPAISVNFPDFKASDILTPEGEKRLKLIHDTDAGVSSAVAILSAVEISSLFQPNWRQNPHFQSFQNQTSNGGKPIKGPLFIAHGKADPVLTEGQVSRLVQKTAEVNPDASITYYALEDVSHVSALAGSQYLWMDWIGDRFAGKEVGSGFRRVEIGGVRGKGQEDQNWYLECATKPWHAPGP